MSGGDPLGRTMNKIMVRVMLTFALVLIGIMVAAVLMIDRYGSVDRAQKADVIIVLGSQVNPGGRAAPSLARRANHAVTLYRRGLAPFVLCSGGVGRYPPSEARVACDLVAAQGVPPENILLEEGSRSTEENAINSSAIMRRHNWHTAILASDGYHLYRSVLMFERMGIVAYASPAQATAGPMNLLERAVREAREAAALGWYWLKTFLGLPITNLKFGLQVGPILFSAPF